MSQTVREARPADATAVYRIARESWHETYDPFLGAEAVESFVEQWYEIDDLESSISGAADREDATFLVAEAPDEYDTAVVGFAHAGPDPENADVAYLFRIYVKPDAWHDGIGTALLERAEAELRGSFERFRMNVLAENELGRAFAESVGFERIETVPSELDPDVDSLVYEKWL